MLEFLDDNFLTQLVKQPTRENNVLDLIIVSNDNLLNDVTVGEHLGSCDHCILRASINVVSRITDNKTLFSNFRRAKFNSFRRAMASFMLPEELDVENAGIEFKNNLTAQQEKFVPYREKRKIDNFNHPWINNE